MKQLSSKIKTKLSTPTDAASLGMFRILFGLLMIWQATYYLFKHRYYRNFLEPKFHFSYQFFEFVRPLPEPYLMAVFVLMAIAALGIMLGLMFRCSALIFLLSYCYVFLLDKAYYNNHYYAIILLSFLMLVTNGQRWLSFDQWRRRKPEVVPYWNLFLFKAQIFIIYFYGGIAKLNADWLHGEPMRSWLKRDTEVPVIGPWLQTELAAYFFSYGGLLFDLSIGFLLWWRKTRWFAFLLILFFNLSNNALFHIGVFPFLMIGAATLFDEPDWPRKLFKIKRTPELDPGAYPQFRSRGAIAFVAIYLSIQALVPFRHWWFPGNVSWTEEGHLFSWHMKLRDKNGRLRIYVTNPQNGLTTEWDPRTEINKFQYGKMVHRPQFIYQYLQHVRDEAIRQGNTDPIIKVDSRMSLNGRPYQTALDPNVDFAKAKMKFFAADEWILPLDPNAERGALSKQEYEGHDEAKDEE